MSNNYEAEFQKRYQEELEFEKRRKEEEEKRKKEEEKKKLYEEYKFKQQIEKELVERIGKQFEEQKLKIAEINKNRSWYQTKIDMPTYEVFDEMYRSYNKKYWKQYFMKEFGIKG